MRKELYIFIKLTLYERAWKIYGNSIKCEYKNARIITKPWEKYKWQNYYKKLVKTFFLTPLLLFYIIVFIFIFINLIIGILLTIM